MSKLKSKHLCQLSPNLLKSPRKHSFDEFHDSDVLQTKRRCLEPRSRSRRGEIDKEDIICNTQLEDTELDFQFAHVVESDEIYSFRREIRIDLLEIVDLMDEIDGIRSSIYGDFEARCTLEVFLARYEDQAKRTGLVCGEAVWRSQQMCTIRTMSDDFGHSTSNLIMPAPFLIQAEDLLETKCPTALKISLSDQYVVKVWLEAPSTKCRWPPLELESALDPRGRIITSLREGAFSSTALRLMGKGVLFPEKGVCDMLEMTLKLGDSRVRTKYALKLDVKYSIPPKHGTPLNLPQTLVKEALSNSESISGVDAYSVGLMSISPPDLDIIDVSVEEHEIPDVQKERRALHPPLAVPHTKNRLCGAVVKDVLTAGEELDPVDDEAETEWQVTRHQEMIRDLPDVTDTMKEYIVKWVRHICPLKLSCNLYLPQILLGFVRENITWFAEDPRRVKDYSLHAASLRLRGSISIDCLAKCTEILRKHIKYHKKSVNMKSSLSKTTNHPVDDHFHSKHSTGQIPVDKGAVFGKVLPVNLNISHTDDDKSNAKAAYADTAYGETLDFKPKCVHSLDEGFGYSESNETFEDASEDLDVPELEEFFDAEYGIDV